MDTHKKTSENLTDTLAKIKKDYENAITTGGRQAAHSLIRSIKLIGHLHEFIKNELVSQGIHPSKIYPPPGVSRPELKMTGFLKTKSQDICVLPQMPKSEIIDEGVLIGKTDKIGKEIMNKSISINIRSQLSSIAKNFDTLYERTFAEPLNLHMRAPKLIMGEVYMVPLIAYDPDKMNYNDIGWKENLPIKYIPSFQMLANRETDTNSEFKYERLSLLIVDFREDPPKVITSLKSFIDIGIISRKDAEKYSLSSLSITDFVPDILKIYEKRHGSIRDLKSRKSLNFFK